jgi:mannose-6-phosphate isomerase-like protein (cupin superfamily)
MTFAGRVLDDGASRMELTLTGAETDGALHEMEVTYGTGSPFPPPHLHPAQDEHFEVHEGVMLFLVDGVEHVVGAGGSIDILRGCVHQARNHGSEPARVTWQTRPALRTAEFFVTMFEARMAGDIDGILGAVQEYDDVFVLAEQPVRTAAPAPGSATASGSTPSPAG